MYSLGFEREDAFYQQQQQEQPKKRSLGPSKGEEEDGSSSSSCSHEEEEDLLGAVRRLQQQDDGDSDKENEMPRDALLKRLSGYKKLCRCLLLQPCQLDGLCLFASGRFIMLLCAGGRTMIWTRPGRRRVSFR